MEQIENFSKSTERFIQPAFANPYFMAILKITLTLYASSIAPNPPPFMQSLFKNTFFKMLALALILYISQVDFQLSIILSVAFVITMNVLSGRSILESFIDTTYAPYEKKYTPVGSSKLLEPHLHVHPGCLNITTDNLVALFEGDSTKMQTTINQAYHQLLSNTKGNGKQTLQKIAQAIGLPYNVNWNDPMTAPYIATLLINAGFLVSESCQPPNDGAGEWKKNFA
ncbi:hypothetical protein EBZ38_05720 [bacterium]|nr:hypothetical protein [bacterium]